MESPPILVTLDRPRRVRWTERAQARNSSLARPVGFTHLARGKNRLYALCALLWAALVDRDHGFEEPEDIAEYLATEDQQVAALEAIRAMIDEAYPQKKSAPTETSSDTRVTSAANGPAPSSNTALPVQDGTISSRGNPSNLSAHTAKSSREKRATKPTS